ILIDPARDKVAVDDEPLKLEREYAGPRIYIVMNKPKHVFSTNVAQGEQTRAIDLLPPNFPRVYPVGRLDAESKGLLLLTNDGELTNKLTHPRYGVAKTYRAIVDGYVRGADLDDLKHGIWLADPRKGKGFKTGRSHITILKRNKHGSTLEIIIREGRNRQIRRMLAKIGHKVRDLTRVKMGPLTLHNLAPGQFRPLTKRELHELMKMPKEHQPSTHDDRHALPSNRPETARPASGRPEPRGQRRRRAHHHDRDGYRG
ncbi:MAG TPA: pseudouridine synthase, partial [Tepidisphaeraceae bacterium]|nr:pseudouridine synthase [Tepidisphaeraceae bacterium]